jgi:hypothetical protein
MTNEVRTDHVTVATSFEVDIDRLDYLEPTLLASFARETGGIPALTAKFEPFISQVFMVGVASSRVWPDHALHVRRETRRPRTCQTARYACLTAPARPILDSIGDELHRICTSGRVIFLLGVA